MHAHGLSEPGGVVAMVGGVAGSAAGVKSSGQKVVATKDIFGDSALGGPAKTAPQLKQGVVGVATELAMGEGLEVLGALSAVVIAVVLGDALDLLGP